MADDQWDPKQYGRYTDERAQPFYDLVGLVEAKPDMTVVDLGCGTGALTRHLHDTIGAARTIGVDASPTMLAKAAPNVTDTLRFEEADISTWSPPEPVDLVLSNAALQWITGHEALFAHLRSMLRPGGQLAVQMPAVGDQPWRLAAKEVVARPAFVSLVPAELPVAVLEPEEYAEILFDLGFPRSHVRLVVYQHLLESRQDVVDWMKGSMLSFYEKQIGPALFPMFVTAYAGELLPRLRDDKPFLFTFPRVLLWAELD